MSSQNNKNVVVITKYSLTLYYHLADKIYIIYMKIYNYLLREQIKNLPIKSTFVLKLAVWSGRTQNNSQFR